MKLLSTLLGVMLLAATPVLADTKLTALTPDNNTVTLGDIVHFEVTGDTDGVGTQNDWLSTEFDVIPDGQLPTCVAMPNHSLGSGVGLTASWDYTTIATGTLDVQVKAFRGANCTGISETISTDLTVDDVPPAPSVPSTPSPEPKTSTVRGGGCGGDLCRYNALFSYQEPVQNPSALEWLYIQLVMRLYDLSRIEQ